AREARTCRETPRGGATARRVCEQQRPPLASCCFSLRERQLPARVGVDRNRDRMARECIVRIRLTVGGSNGLPLCRCPSANMEYIMARNCIVLIRHNVS